MVYQVSGIYPLTSGRQTQCQATLLVMSANLIHLLYHNFRRNVKKKKRNVLVLSKEARLYPRPEGRGFSLGDVDNRLLVLRLYLCAGCDSGSSYFTSSFLGSHLRRRCRGFLTSTLLPASFSYGCLEKGMLVRHCFLGILRVLWELGLLLP